MRMIVLVLVLLASIAHAEKKPTLAVLGVIPKDTSLVKAATALDDALRTAANAKASPYRVKGSSRQVADAIRTAECSTNEVACAAALGASLGADFALAGELEKRGASVELTIIVVDVAKKQKIRSLRDKTVGSADMRKLARKSFDKLTGVDEPGELVIVANAKRGKIYIDGELRAELFESRATIALPSGRYRLLIEAPGHRAFEDLVNVLETTTLNVLLD